MQLVFEVCDTANGEPPASKVFDGAGGVIGRGAGCDWTLPDASRSLSSHHGLVSYREGQYYLTDISSNGIGVSGGTERLLKGRARLIAEGEIYQLGPVNIRARLVAGEAAPDRPTLARVDTIPDDAFLGLDPVHALDHARSYADSSEDLDALQTLAQMPICELAQGAVERDHLIVPRWAEPEGTDAPPQPPTVPIPQAFWSQFGDALGVRVDALDTPGREALALKVAGLFKQTIDGVRQSLRTRDELNMELNLSGATPTLSRRIPLRECADTQAALTVLLGITELDQLPAELAISQANREIQVHQLALVVACRASLRAAVAAFAPGHLLLCFEREDSPPRFSTDGAYWRAYQRHYRRMVDGPGLDELLLRSDFSKAYAEQVRLVSTLHSAYPG
ncbi:type VI secretion protein [Pseudomonas fluorescens]|nr:type VI secretion protein [Pseudomonas fluorescens]